METNYGYQKKALTQLILNGTKIKDKGRNITHIAGHSFF